MITEHLYTTQLQAGLGLVHETRTLLDIWEPNMTSSELYQRALDSGSFPKVTARRLRNVVSECFAPRYLVNKGTPALILKKLGGALTSSEFNQLLFLYTCRANLILADFVREIYWGHYSSGQETITNADARDFVTLSNQQRKTSKQWSGSTIRRVSAYLTGCCADFDLLERGRKIARRIIHFRIEPHIGIILAYDLHFAGLGDNSLIVHKDWQLFGFEQEDVRDELKRLSLKGLFIIQTAGEVTHISWNCKSWEDLIHVITQS